MLAQFGRETALGELVEGLMELQEGVLGRDPLSALDALRKNMPTEEEMAILKR
jgi:hypothetical protein